MKTLTYNDIEKLKSLLRYFYPRRFKVVVTGKNVTTIERTDVGKWKRAKQ